MFGVGDSITDDILKEDLVDLVSLVDTTTTHQTIDSSLGTSLGVILKDFMMTLSAFPDFLVANRT